MAGGRVQEGTPTAEKSTEDGDEERWVRFGTSLALVVLLAIIVIAAIVQLTRASSL